MIKSRHPSLGRCKRYDFPCAKKRYEHVVGKEHRVLEKSKAKILSDFGGDFNIQTDWKTEHNKPDIVVVAVSCPLDTRMVQKQQEKLDVHIYMYTYLRYEILKFWKDEMKNGEILPIVILRNFGNNDWKRKKQYKEIGICSTGVSSHYKKGAAVDID